MAKKKRSASSNHQRSNAHSVATTRNARRPRRLVVFKQPGSEILDLSRKLLRLRVVEECCRPGVTVLLPEKTRGNRVHSRVYPDLGVAALDIDSEEQSKLESLDEVGAVLPNQTRRVPPPLLRYPGSPFLSGSGLSLRAIGAYAVGARYMAATFHELLGGQSPPLVPQSGANTQSVELLGIDASYSKRTGKGVKLAVLDTGLDLGHPDFVGRVQEGTTAVSFVAAEPSAQDENGHGTHCAGIAAGPAASAGGPRYGVAPDVDLYVGKVLNQLAKGSDDQIIDGINWAYQQGARIISLSLGSYRAIGEPYSPLYEDLANELRKHGVLMVSATGNDAIRPYLDQAVENPAACPSILSVAAVDHQEQIAKFSNKKLDAFGDVNLSAPGVQVHSAMLGGGWVSMNGTSMATPHVAGLAALYLEEDPSLTVDSLCQALKQSALSLGDVSDFGAGLPQAP